MGRDEAGGLSRGQILKDLPILQNILIAKSNHGRVLSRGVTSSDLLFLERFLPGLLLAWKIEQRRPKREAVSPVGNYMF